MVLGIVWLGPGKTESEYMFDDLPELVRAQLGKEWREDNVKLTRY